MHTYMHVISVSKETGYRFEKLRKVVCASYREER